MTQPQKPTIRGYRAVEFRVPQAGEFAYTGAIPSLAADDPEHVFRVVANACVRVQETKVWIMEPVGTSQLVTFRGGPALDNGKQRRLHPSKMDGNEFTLSGGYVMGEPVPDRIFEYRDGEAHFVRWA